jgi:hypothetical protein
MTLYEAHRYLAGNIARGFAAAQFLRENPSPMLSTLTESEPGVLN